SVSPYLSNFTPMSLRTFDEIKASVSAANLRFDGATLEADASELERLGTDEASAVALGARGAARLYAGDNQAALELFTKALDLYEGLGHTRGMAATHVSLGNYCFSVGNHASALKHFQRATGLYEQLGDVAGLAKSISSCAIVHHVMGDSTLALEQFNRALDSYDSLGLQLESAHVLNSIGILYNTLGQFVPALTYFQRALSIHEKFEDISGSATVLANLGMVHAGMSDADKALEFFQRAISIHEQLDQHQPIAYITGNIGTVFYNTGRIDESEPWLRKAVELSRDMGAAHQQAFFTELLCGALYAQKRLDEYHELHDANVDLMRRYRDVEAQLSITEAKVLVDAQDLDGARSLLQQSLANVSELGERFNELTFHRELRDLARLRNDFEGFIIHNDAYTAINDELRGADAARKFQMQIAEQRIEAERKEYEKHMAVLHSTLPKHIADRVARGEVVNDAFDNAAVLFLDVAGFTTNSSALDAGVVVELLQNIFTTFDAICEQHDVMKIKTIGDSYMAVAFGTANTEQRTANTEQRTANTEQRAANVIPRLAVEQRIANVARAMMSSPFTWPHTNERVMFRIGLHCGAVVAGVLGTERLQYDVWGDTVNVASRMESTSEPGRIHVSASFAETLNSPPSPLSHASLERENMRVVERGMVEIKGKGAMQTFWLE
ncbi:MAG: tetratricopeptide repeat protein, partial [Candidatus Kapabacteria bacterium]|nr:tetratricopeptide repeat protein [Candidatus Kapabacteria bacterium]